MREIVEQILVQETHIMVLLLLLRGEHREHTVVTAQLLGSVYDGIIAAAEGRIKGTQRN